MAADKSRMGRRGTLVTKLALAPVTREKTKLQPMESRSEISGGVAAPDNVTRNLRLENTYRLEPDDGQRFSSVRTAKVVEEYVKGLVGDQKYSAEVAKKLSKDISTGVKDRVKELGYKRYKFVVQVVVGEALGQDIRVGSRCIWDAKSDNVSWVQHDNASIFVTVMIFGVYFD